MSTSPPSFAVFSSKPTIFRFLECTTESRHLEALFLIGNDSCADFILQQLARIPNHTYSSDVSRSTNLKFQFHSNNKNVAFTPPSLANPIAPVPLFSVVSPVGKDLTHPLRVSAVLPWHHLGHHFYRTETQIIHIGKTSMRMQLRYFTVPRSQIGRDFNDRSQDAQYSQLAPDDEPERQFATSVATLAFIDWEGPDEGGHRGLKLAPCPIHDRSLIMKQTAHFFRPETLSRRSNETVRPSHAFLVDLPLRFSDIDELGHVTNSRYPLLVHDVLTHGLGMGYYANGSGTLATPQILPVYSRAVPTISHVNIISSDAVANIPAGSKYYKDAEVVEFYVGYENELKIEEKIIVWSWVERERIIDRESHGQPMDVTDMMALALNNIDTV
ncbi:hypothetical protein FBU30_003600 [Linnemannia zychae]|nr:hypothetical protein FBU30_003600 [Linnemannia zychae]